MIQIGTAATYTIEQCVVAQKAITFYRGKYRQHRERMSLSGPVPRVWYQDCAAVRRRAGEWREKAKSARELLMSHYTIANTDNWVRAMRYAQKPFPGTRSWLEFISSRECRACWTTPGGFICNYQGSGACGPMQFMSGTFYGYADDARAHLNARGYLVAREVWDWRNPLGQALTAAYMRYTGRDGCHWCL